MGGILLFYWWLVCPMWCWGYVCGVWGWSWEGVSIWVAFGEFYVAGCGYVLSGEAWSGGGGWWVVLYLVLRMGDCGVSGRS
jgi:hypothetical protein